MGQEHQQVHVEAVKARQRDQEKKQEQAEDFDQKDQNGAPDTLADRSRRRRAPTKPTIKAL